MGESPAVDRYFDTMIQEGERPNKGNLQFHMQVLFGDIDLRGKRFLDIGGGTGLFSLYAASCGAAESICLEPEGEGGTSGVNQKFKRLKSLLNLDNVFLEPQTFQAYTSSKPFDVILMHNSINHLDEDACETLLESEESRARYREVFRKMSEMSSPGAKLIACDCARNNFWNSIGLRSPVASTIEWEKHQGPETWAAMLAEVGYRNPRITWTSFNSLRGLGKALLGNKLAAYFLMSHFCLKMEKA